MTKLEANGLLSSRSPEPGIYAPTVTLFTKDKEQDLDLEATAAHAVRYFLQLSFCCLLSPLLIRPDLYEQE